MSELPFFSKWAPKTMIARVGVLVVLLSTWPHPVRGLQGPSVPELLRQFEGEKVFWRQFDVAKAIVSANDTSVFPRLKSWLTHDDRQLRGNAAFVFAGLGDHHGLDVIVSILSDHSEKREVHQISSVGSPSIQGQIRQDRYYAAHLLGDLKDPRAIPILVPLLTDAEVNYIVPWSLGQIGGRSAITPLIGSLSDPDPNMRVLAIHALVELKATEALPRLRQLFDDGAKSTFDKLESVAYASQTAVAQLQLETR